MTKLISFTEECQVCGKSHSTENEFIQCIDKHDKRKLTFKILNFIEKVFKFKFPYKITYPNEIIERYESKIDWYNVSKYQQLSGHIIERYRDKLDWNYISSYHELSETTIAKCYNKIEWIPFIHYQDICKEFIEKVLKHFHNNNESELHIITFLSQIGYDLNFVFTFNKHCRNFKKHILTILSESEIQLNEEFKNELLSIILRET